MSTQPAIRLNIKILPGMLAVFLLMEVIDPSKIWVVLLIGLGLAWLVSYIWVHLLARHLSLRREIRFGWAQVGDRLEERFTLENESFAPALWVEIADQSTLPDYPASRVTGIGERTSMEWRTEALCTRRGLYMLGPTNLKTGDPFGIYSLDMHLPFSQTVIILPPVVALPGIEVAPGGRSGSGRPRTNAPERTVSASNVRQYVPGDNLHSIHWRTTARRGSPYVRIFDGTPAGDWRILLDLNQEVQLGEGWDSTVEHAVILAASLADRGLRLHHSVGLGVNGSEPVWMPPKPGEERRWEILRTLALVKPGDHSLAEYLRQVSPGIRSNTSLVVITPSVEGDWLQELIPLMWRGVMPTLLLLDPVSFSPATEPAPALQSPRELSQLASFGVKYYLIPRELLNQPGARPGLGGQWEWRISPRGRAIAVRRPADLEWKSVS